MRKTLFLSTALGAAALLAGPAFAQSQAPSAAPLGMQQQAARQADDMSGRREASSLLQQADQAAARGQWGRANELLERAQTARLNQHVLSGGSTGPGDMRAFEDARQALSRRDRAAARSAFQSAMSGSGRDSSMMGSGSSTGSMPMQGGGMGSNNMGHSSMGSSSMPGHGGATMCDSGMGDRSMSRADIILAQGTGGGGSGGLSGSTPGSPGAGNPGSTPSTIPGTATQPPQGSALQGSMSSTTGPGAPAPGSLTPAPGTTSAGSRTTTGSSGANPPASTGAPSR